MARNSPGDLARSAYRAARARAREREARSFRASLRFDPQAPALLLSPHWDDAVLDCWGLLTDPGPLQVVNLFAAEAPSGSLTMWDAITGASGSAARTRERRDEDARALALAGRAPVSLTLLDEQYRRERISLRELDTALVAVAPAASAVHVPAGIGAHPDHVLAREYGRALLAGGMPVTLYAELPYCVLHGWPHWVDAREPDSHRDVDAFWGSFLGDVRELGGLREAQVLRLDDARAAAKLTAMRCYETQLPALSYGARGLLEDPEIHRYEVSWRLKG